MLINKSDISLKPLLPEDIPLFEKWLDKDYIYKRLCPDGEEQREAWLNEVTNKDGKCDFLSHFIVYHNDRKIGYCLYADCFFLKDLEEEGHDFEGLYGDVSEPNHTFEIGYLIGEEDYLNKGISKVVIQQLEEKIIELSGREISADPSEENSYSVKALLSNGFKKKRDGDYRKVISLIEKGTIDDIDELERLYDDLNDYLSANTHYPGWIKGIYPIRETAEKAIEEGSLYVLKKGNVIAGSVVLNHEPETAYEGAEWSIDVDYDKILVIRTLVVHPKFMKQGVAKQLMDFTKELAVSSDMKSIRLDVSVDNTPAIKLYEQSGYKYVGTVDLGLPYEHLKWFRLYELVLQKNNTKYDYNNL